MPALMSNRDGFPRIDVQGHTVRVRATRGIERFDGSDMQPLEEFLQQCGYVPSWLDGGVGFQWRFAANPLCGADGPSFWVCRRENQIVGQIGGVPIDFFLGGRRVRALWAIDLLVAHTWRLRGIAPALMVHLSEGYDVVAGLGVSKPARLALLRAGWLDLGIVPRFVRLLQPLRPGEGIGGNWRSGMPESVLSQFAAPGLAGFDRTVDLAARCFGLSSVPVPAFDSRVDALSESASTHFHCMASRNHEFLSWRFDAAPHAAEYHRYYLMRGSELVGYFVLRRKGVQMLLVDHLCALRRQPALFAHSLIAARQRGARALNCLAMPPASQAILHALGFLRVGGPHLMVSSNQQQRDDEFLVSPRNWHLTFADSDLD